MVAFALATQQSRVRNAELLSCYLVRDQSVSSDGNGIILNESECLNSSKEKTKTENIFTVSGPVYQCYERFPGQYLKNCKYWAILNNTCSLKYWQNVLMLVYTF